MLRRDFVAEMVGALAVGCVGPGWRPRAGPPAGLGALSVAPDSLRVNPARLNRHLSQLAEFGRTPSGGTSRLAYSEADRAGRDYVRRLMREARLAVRVDTGGNILGRRPGRDPALPPILFGSHIDSVPEGGNYDGDVGSLGAIECVQTLAENGVVTRHPLEAVVFSNEEGGLIGSRAMIGELGPAELDLVSRSGKTIREGIPFIGGDPDRLALARRVRGDVACYLELHVEQGGTLHEAGVSIGVVEGIVGIRWYEVTIEGFANHAGTTPMDRRRDALLAAAQLILAVNGVVTAEPGRQVGTVGRISALPGAPNVIPGRVVLSVELRDLSAERIESLYRRVVVEAERIARDSGTRVSFRLLNENTPAPTDPAVRRVIAEACRSLGLSHRALPSGAGHDAQHLARIAPVGMIFVPSVDGISHSPAEFTRPEDVAQGADVLLQAILAIDRGGLEG
ncbi:MAG: Zn-dependent hydrolase [Gemmatimonadetes bacterium]|nr:Zn-dependent hydrolase [Gemmatimonadota bacterium]